MVSCALSRSACVCELRYVFYEMIQFFQYPITGRPLILYLLQKTRYRFLQKISKSAINDYVSVILVLMSKRPSNLHFSPMSF